MGRGPWRATAPLRVASCHRVAVGSAGNQCLRDEDPYGRALSSCDGKNALAWCQRIDCSALGCAHYRVAQRSGDQRMRKGPRQEVLNTVLAQLLQERGVVSAPEDVIVPAKGGNRDIPDILANFQGLRTAIECEVDDQPKAKEKAIASARDRVVAGIAHIGIAIVYPKSLREGTFDQLRSDLAATQLQIAVVTESKESGYSSGDVNYLESALRQTFGEIVQEDVVAEAAAQLDAGVEHFAGVVAGKAGVVQRLASALGIRELPKPRRSVEEDSE